jgi:hypothetical protein
MRRWMVGATALLLVVAFAMPAFAAGSSHRLGFGAHYWRNIDGIAGDDGTIYKKGISWVPSYQYDPGSILKFELDVEIFPDDFAGSTAGVISPQVMILAGKTIYVGAGVGALYSSGDFTNPFYFFRAGLDLELLPSIAIDINGNYRFGSKEELSDSTTNIDTDTVTLGGAVRISF